MAKGRFGERVEASRFRGESGLSLAAKLRVAVFICVNGRGAGGFGRVIPAGPLVPKDDVVVVQSTVPKDVVESPPAPKVDVDVVVG